MKKLEPILLRMKIAYVELHYLRKNKEDIVKIIGMTPFCIAIELLLNRIHELEWVINDDMKI